MGILESLKRTGLLEDTRLAIELRVSQGFEWARRVLRAACRLPPPPTSLHSFLSPAKLPPPPTHQHPSQQHKSTEGGPSQPDRQRSSHAPHSAFGALDSDVGVAPEEKKSAFGGLRDRAARMDFAGVLTSAGLSGQPQVCVCVCEKGIACFL